MDLALATTEHLVGVLCYCQAQPDGHRLDHPACVTVIQPGRYIRPSLRTLVEQAQGPDFVAVHRAMRRRPVACERCGRPVPSSAYPSNRCSRHA